MKRYILFMLPLLLALCLMVGCGGQSGMHSRLAAVDSIVDSRYDSALTVLRGMDTLQMRRSDRMYLELLRAKAMNKASVPFTTDSVMRRLAQYYDRHGSPNQRLLAHYLLGCVYRDLRSAPRALEEYQRAASQADTTRAGCDLPTLMRVYSQMSKLYMMMRLTDESLQMGRKAQKVCYLMGDYTAGQISRKLYGMPFNTNKVKFYIRINVKGLSIIQNNPNNFLLPGNIPLNLHGRIIDSGISIFKISF